MFYTVTTRSAANGTLTPFNIQADGVADAATRITDLFGGAAIVVSVTELSVAV